METKENIKIGEYIRTIKGIKKVYEINKNAAINRYLVDKHYDHGDTEYNIIRTTEVIKHSKNLLDLIEIKEFKISAKMLDYLEEDKQRYIKYLADNGIDYYKLNNTKE